MFGNMKLGTKLGFVFTVLVLITLIVGGVGYWGAGTLGAIADDLAKNRLVKVGALGTISEAQTAVKASERTLMITGLDRGIVARQMDYIKRAWERADKTIKAYEALPLQGEGQALYKKFQADWAVWKKDHQEFMRLYDEAQRSNNNPVVVARMMSHALDQEFKSFDEAEKSLNSLIEYNNKQATAQTIAADAKENTVKYSLLGAMLFAILFALIMGFVFVRSIQAIIGNLLGESNRLVQAAIGGKLDTRGDVRKINFEFRPIVEGVNKTLDAVIGPLNVAAEYVDRISKGDIPPKITDQYNGDFNEIKNNLNQAIDAVNALVADANKLSVAAVEGKLDTRADASKHGGDFRKIVEGVNKTLDAVIGPLNVAAEYVDRISKGDIPPKITDKYNGDFNEIKNNLNQAIDAVNALVADAGKLSVAAVEGKLDTRADASKHGGDFRKIVEGVNKTLDAVIGPLNVAAEYVDRISKGDIPPKITDQYHGDFNEIKNNLNQAIDAVNALVADAVMLSVAAVEGKLDTRADASKHGGDFRKIVEGVNKTLDAVIGPLNVAAEYVDRISKGDIPPKITDKYNGDFNEIKNNLNNAIDNITALVLDAGMLSVAAAEGKLDTRADASKHGGDFRKIVEGVNKTLDAVIGPLNVAAEYVDRISKGDIPPKITDKYNGDFNEIKNNLNNAIDNITALVIDAGMLSVAAVEGKLATRADASKHGGDFRKIVEGVNKTLDSVIGPLNVAADYVDKISRGDIPPKITDNYNGDFNTIKNNLNKAIDAVNALVADAVMLSVAAVEGKLDTRADASKHGGDYRKIVEGVNKTLDAVIGPLNVAAGYVEKISKGDIPPKITDKYNGDFNALKNNLNQCIDAVNGLISESVMLSKAAVEGRLQTRGKAEKFEGGYREIVQGVNDTLDAVLKPITEASDCLKEMANGNLNVLVKGDYQGDHSIIKDALNGTIDATNEILGQVSVAVEQVSAGSREIATSSQALSQGATESASAVEEISASMQEMGSQTNQNAENATQANQLAVMARDKAEKGNQQMAQMVKAMGDINQSANNISKIIKVIDEIAFQTNLLALNAAVEAARAGKHGKGFTVVAEEVRNLAQRSAKAAKETTEMIEDSIKRTEVGTTIAENTSKALEEIQDGATKVADLISEIAAASKEQAQGIGQINNGLSQVDQVTQQNTASAEEMASAGEELSSQSLQLKQMLAKFQLRKGAGGTGGGYGGDYRDAGPAVRQSNTRQKVDVPWGGVPAKPGRKNPRGGENRPEDIISLDDQHFGKF